MRQVEAGQPYNATALHRRLTPAVAEVVQQQAEVGIDIPSDGEFGKRGWTSYVAERLGGLESSPERVRHPDYRHGRHAAMRGSVAFTRSTTASSARSGSPATKRAPLTPRICRRPAGGPQPITYTGRDAVKRDIANFTAALQRVQSEASCP